MSEFPYVACINNSGAGFPVGPDKVITARHVVAGVDVGGVAWVTFPLAPEGEHEPCLASVIWLKDDPEDVVVLQLPAGAPRLKWKSVAKRAPKEFSQWLAVGFPRVMQGKKAKGKAAKPSWEPLQPLAVSGKVQTSLRDGKYSLTVATKVDETRDWAGLSGAGVVVGDQLVGVIVDGIEALNGQILHCTGTHWLLQDPEFRAALDWQRAETELLREQIEGVLKSDLALCAELASKLTPKPANTPTGITDALFNGTALDALRALNHADHSIMKRGVQSAGVIEIVRHLIPRLIDSSRVEVVEFDAQHAGTVWLRLNFATETLAELVVAWHYECPADLSVKRDRKHPTGPGRLELPPKGTVIGEEDEYHEFESMLATRYECTGENRLADLNARLAHLRLEAPEKSIAYVAVTSAAGRPQLMEVLRLIRARIPTVTILELAGDPTERTEGSMREHLRDLYGRRDI